MSIPMEQLFKPSYLLFSSCFCLSSQPFHPEDKQITFPVSLQRGLGSYSFILFAVVCLVALIYIWLVVPETKNKTFLEVSQMFAKRNKTEIKVGVRPLKDSTESLEKVTTF